MGHGESGIFVTKLALGLGRTWCLPFANDLLDAVTDACHETSQFGATLTEVLEPVKGGGGGQNCTANQRVSPLVDLPSR